MTGKMYRIGEASAALGLKSYVLRFWETEFPQLEPVRTEKGQRLYTEEHLELLKLIKHLLHERGLTIDGARRILNSPDSQKLLQEDSGPMIASEFSSDLILGRPFADEEYEDDEPADPPDARLGDLLDEISMSLKISGTCSPLYLMMPHRDCGKERIILNQQLPMQAFQARWLAELM